MRQSGIAGVVPEGSGAERGTSPGRREHRRRNGWCRSCSSPWAWTRRPTGRATGMSSRIRGSRRPGDPRVLAVRRDQEVPWDPSVWRRAERPSRKGSCRGTAACSISSSGGTTDSWAGTTRRRTACSYLRAGMDSGRKTGIGAHPAQTLLPQPDALGARASSTMWWPPLWSRAPHTARTIASRIRRVSSQSG